MINKKGEDIIKSREGLRLKAYLCPAGYWTIGWGSRFYENGNPVKEGDIISKERAEQLFKHVTKYFHDEIVNKLLKVKLNENQLSALISFAFNVGLDIDADFIVYLSEKNWFKLSGIFGIYHFPDGACDRSTLFIFLCTL